MDIIQYVIRLKDEMSGTLNTISANTQKINADMAQSNTIVTELRNNFIAFFGLRAGIGLIGDIVDITTKMQTLDNVINYTSLDAADAKKNHEFLADIIDRMKLPLVETTEGFSQFNAALLGSKLQGQGARDIFEGVSTGITAMHLSAQQAGSIFLALNQIMSKGKLQAQEMTLQLAQALPGAQRIAATAMHMTTAEFMKQMEAGKILAEDFLPKFAAQLKEQFGGAIPNAIQSLQARLTDMNNKWLEFKLSLGESLYPVIIRVIDGLTGLTTWLQKNQWVLLLVATALALVVGYWIGYSAYLALGNTLLAINTVRTFLSMVATDGFSAALYAAGVAGAVAWGMITLGLSLVIAGLILAYNKSEKFRAVISGIGTVIKGLYPLLKGMAEVLVGTLTFNPEMIASGLAAFGQGLSNLANKGVKGMFAEGYNASLAGETENNPANAMQNAHALGSKMKDSGAGAGALSTSSNKVSETKPTIINIKIDKFGEIHLTANNIYDAASKIHDHITKALVAAVNDAQILGGQ